VAAVTPALGRREQRFAELAELADVATGRHRRTDLDPDLAPLATLATRLRDGAAVPSAREEYRLGLRAMLLATIDREGIGATAVIPAQRGNAKPTASSSPSNLGAGRRTRFAVLIGVTGALALSGVSQASVHARPGDPLYSVKLSAERAQLALAGSDVTRGKLLFDYANIRLQETSQVDDLGRPAVLADMNAKSTEGFRLLAGEAVDQKNQRLLTVLDDLVRQWQGGFASVNASWQTDPQWRDSAGVAKIENERLAQLGRVLRGECELAPSPDAYGPVPMNCPSTSSTNSKAGR
jgi:hypothetical protein